jgi:hypothetical protein
MVTDLRAVQREFDSRQVLGRFLLATASRLALGSAQPLIQWLSWVKQSGNEADHSPPSDAKVKSAWSYTSTPPVRFYGVVLSIVPVTIIFFITNQHEFPFAAVAAKMICTQCKIRIELVEE